MAVDLKPERFLEFRKILDFRTRKGFYFSFDAFLALAVMSASLLIVAQSSDISNDAFKSETLSYQKSSLAGQDAMKLASRETFREFNSSFQQELVDQTVMTSSDLDRKILDGISLLWAARNFSYAETAAKRYFDARVPERYGYRLQVTEGGNTTELYQTSKVPENADSITSISRLVSGHKIDRPSEGFQARARATKVRKNQTKIVSMPPLGSANDGGKMTVKKEFWLNDTSEIYNGTFYISVHYNGNSHFENFKINGNQYGEAKFNWIHDDGTSAYGKLDVTGDLKEGKNTLFVRTKATSFHTHFHPGTKLEIDYRTNGTGFESSQLRHERIYLEDIVSENPGDESGVFTAEEFVIPERAEFVNASYYLHARKMDSQYCNYDVRVLLNGDVKHTSCASGTYKKQLNLSDVQNGTNVVTTYLNVYGNTFWGGKETRLYSDFSTNSSSHIDLWYKVDKNDLRFGEIRVTTSEKVGGTPQQPKFYEKEFNYSDLASTQLYIAQQYSYRPGVYVDSGSGYRKVFQSSGSRSSPTRLYAGSGYYSTSVENNVKMNDTDSAYVYLPESSFQWTMWVPSQVGYGNLYENRSAAVKDARRRLKSKLGRFVEATGLDTDSLSTGNQPYLWGPASVKLVIWRE